MGFLVQSSHGAIGNFELVLPRGSGGGARHWWRDNDQAGLPWNGPGTAFGSPGEFGAASLIQSNFGPLGNLEVVGRQGPKLLHSWRDDGGTWRWITPAPLPGTTAPNGSPELIQGSLGSVGNFEVVAPLAAGGLGHWWRDNDDAGLPWYGPTPFAAGQFVSVGMVEGTFSGHLEVVARQGDQLEHWWRDEAFIWHQAGLVAAGVHGRHDLCQAFLPSETGRYQIVAPVVGGGMGHWWADPVASPLAWHGPTVFGAGDVAAVGLMEGSNGNLEVVAVLADHVEHWWRDGGDPSQWHGPMTFWQATEFTPAQHGTSEVSFDTAIVGIHAALLKTGKVLTWSFADWNDGVGESRVLHPVTGALETPPESHHLFCSGHAFLPDGRLAVAGGHHADLKSWHTFDPGLGQWQHHQPEMSQGRWYPTCTTLPDGQVLTISGSTMGGPLAPGNPANNSLQRFHPTLGPQAEVPLPSPWSSHFPGTLAGVDLYPFVFVLPSGHLLVHSRHVTRVYDPTNNTWGGELLTNYPFSRTYPCQGSAVLLPLEPPDYRARVMVIGGGGADPEQVTMDTPATNSVEILDLGDSSPEWTAAAPMAFGRVMLDAVLLPDGSVLVAGGSATGKADHGVEPVYAVECFDTRTETWSRLCDIAVPRLYHSTALLLANGRVLAMGKDALFSPDPFHYPEHRGEVVSPPYLFGAPPPTMTAAPAEIHYGQPFSVGTPQGASIDRVNLLRPGSVTHSFNMGQRLVGLAISAASSQTVTVVAPPVPEVAPPGFYLLFVLASGVPSTGRIVHLS